MPPTQRKRPAAAPTPAAAPAGPVFEYVVVVQANPLGGTPDPGPAGGAVQAALNAGYRPAGDPTLTGPVTHEDGVSLVYTWSVPVVKVK